MKKAAISTLFGIIAAIVIGLVVILLLAMLHGSGGDSVNKIMEIFFQLF